MSSSRLGQGTSRLISALPELDSGHPRRLLRERYSLKNVATACAPLHVRIRVRTVRFHTEAERCLQWCDDPSQRSRNISWAGAPSQWQRYVPQRVEDLVPVPVASGRPQSRDPRLLIYGHAPRVNGVCAPSSSTGLPRRWHRRVRAGLAVEDL